MGIRAQQESTERYRRLRKLGQGAMGVVHEAEEVTSGRRFALKTIRNDDPELLYRLKREFRNLAHLRHRNLVRLYELAFEGDEWFFTMELVTGGDFLGYCASPGAPAARAKRLRCATEELIEGLKALHAAGFVHRDIKPSNVLVDESGRVVIVDFGLTSPLLEDQSGTLSAEIAGTAAYLAPELLQSGALTRPEADWYALGVLLFEALCGRRPFVGSDFEVMQQKTAFDAPDVTSLVTDAAADLALLCAQLLSRDPAQRCPSAWGDLFAVTHPGLVLEANARGPSPEELAGRDQELQLLSQELDAARAGACRVVMLHGESGIGKSALVRNFIQRSAADRFPAVALSGRCYQRESVPFRALDGLIDQLSSHWKRLPRDNAMFLVPREPELLLRLFPVLGRVAALTELANDGLRSLQAHEALARSMAALKESLHRLARRTPLILWLDDVQWIDQDSVKLLEVLTSADDPLPALVILTSRPNDAQLTGAPLLDRLLRGARVVALQGLSEQAMRDLIEHVMGAERAELRDLVVREAGGSPFFGLSLARRFELRVTSGSLSPGELLLRDLGNLPEAPRALLELAALAAAPLHPRIAGRAAALPEPAVEEALRSLDAARLTQACAGAVAEFFEPYHDRIRELVVEQISPERRVELHALLARAIDAEPEPDHQACARHYQAANLLEEAAGHALKAAERAEAEFAFVRAAGYYRLCLEVPSLDDEARAVLHSKLARALKNCGRGREAAEEFLRAAACSIDSDRIDCEQRAAEEFLRAGHSEQGMQTLRAVLAHVDLSFPSSAARAIASSLARHGITRIQSSRALRPTPRELNPMDLRRIDVCAGVAHSVGFLEPLMTSYYQALHLRMAIKAGEPSRLCRALAAEAIYTSLPGKPSRHCEALIARAKDIAHGADARGRGVATYSEGVVSFMLGHWQKARELCERGESVLREACTGVQWELDTTMLYVLAALCNVGDLIAAQQRAQRHIGEAEARADLYGLTILRAGSAHVLRLAHDQPDLVESDLVSVMKAWPVSPFSIPSYWELAALTNADLYRGDAERALARFRDWDKKIARSLPMRVQVTRIRMRHARARAALALASDSKDRGLLSQVSADARAIEQEGASWALGLSSALRAGIAVAQGLVGSCIALLETGERQFQDAQMWLDASILRRWKAELIGGTEGATLMSATEQWMSSRGIRNPGAFAQAYAPGLRASR